MKKILVSVLALSILLITACPGGRRDADDLRFAWWGNPLRNQQTDDVLALFTQQTGIEVETMHGTFGEYWPMLATLAAAGNLPDVMQHDVAQLLWYQESNLLFDLRPFIADGRINTSDVPVGILEQGRIGDGIYAIPIGMNMATMVYNRELLTQLGLTAPRNMTTEQFIALSREIYQRSGVRTNWMANDPVNSLHAIMRGQGISVFERTPAGVWRLGGSPANYQVFFEILHQGIQEGWHFRIEHWGGRDRFAMATDPFVYPPNIQANANLRSWVNINWAGAAPALQHELGSEVGLTTLPSANPAQSNFGRASMFWAIPTHANNPDAAAQLINFFINNQAANEIIMFDRGVTANAVMLNTLSPRLDAVNRAAAEYTAWVNQPGNSSPFSALAPPGAIEFRNYLTLVADLVATGQLTPAAAATRIFNEGNAILGR